MAMDNKEDMESLIEEGRKAMKKEDFNAAIAILKRVIENYPEDALAYNLIGVAKLRIGDLEEAKDYIKQALQRENKNPAFMYNMAAVEMASGNVGVVVKILELALTYESHDPSYWSLFGQAFIVRSGKSGVHVKCKIDCVATLGC